MTSRTVEHPEPTLSSDRPNPSAPVACRVRLRYVKRGRMRFTSHRDVARAFERALRRAGTPMAFSQGFSPHPRISWAGAAPTGVASEAEYVELGLIEEVDGTALLTALNASLPEGLQVVALAPASGTALADRIDASHWRIEVTGVGAAELARAVELALAEDELPIERLTKSGRKTVDIRPALVALRVDGPVHAESDGAGERCGILEAVVRQLTPTVRPDDVLNALRVVAGLQPPVPARATRVAQGLLDDAGRITEPLGEGVVAVATGERKPDQYAVE